jgi:hypothetical protein
MLVFSLKVGVKIKVLLESDIALNSTLSVWQEL